jgi:hypothetical protein
MEGTHRGNALALSMMCWTLPVDYIMDGRLTQMRLFQISRWEMKTRRPVVSFK